MTNPVTTVALRGGVFLVPRALAGRFPMQKASCRAVRGDLGGSQLNVAVRTGVRVSFTCASIPKGTPVTARMRIGGSSVTLGTAKAGSKGNVVLPAMKFTQPGRFLVRMSTPGGFSSSFTIIVK